MRGRLIRPLLVSFSRIDQSATRDEQNDTLRAPAVSRPFGAGGTRVTGTKYLAAVQIKAQVEITTVAAQHASKAGNVEDYRLAFVLHRRDLERLSLIDATTGKPLLQNGTRVDAIYNLNGTLQRTFADPAVHVTEVREIGHGLGGKCNLVMLVTDDRPQGLAATP
jgi:hypothetical protein